MAPLDPNVFIDPLDLSAWTNPPGGIDPGFTQDVIDILGDQGSPSDGFDQVVSETLGIVAALDTASAEQDAVLDAILAEHQASDPGQLDTAMQGYMDAFPAGDAVLTSAAGASPPFLGVLPISTNALSAGIAQAPSLQSFDFGTVKLGSPALRYDIGRADNMAGQQTGVFNILVVANTGMDISIGEDERDSASGDNQHFTFWLNVTPSAVGTFSAEVTWNDTVQPTQVNLTLTINVVP